MIRRVISMFNYSPKAIEAMNVVNSEYLSGLLHDLRDKDYLHQRNLQKDSVIIERHSISIDKFIRRAIQVDGKIAVRFKYTAHLDYEFINPQRKLALKRSGLIGNEISYYEIAKQPEIFDKNYLVFIDGELIDAVNVIVNDGGVEFVLNVKQNKEPGIPFKQYKAWLEKGVKVNILFFSNSKFSPLETNRATLKENHKFFSYHNQEFIDSLNDDDHYAAFILTKEDGYRSDLVNVNGKQELLKYFEGMNVIHKKEKAFINIYGFKHLHRMMTISGKDRVFQIPGYKMPIPVENIIPFKKTQYGNKYAGDITFRNHFPNFYEMVGDVAPDEELNLLIFYSQDNYRFDEYYNELASYYKILGDNVDTFLSAPMAVQRYTPNVVDFSIKDYLSKGNKNTPLVYKLDILNRLVDKNPEYLRQFVKDRIETSSGFYLRVANLDLSTRVRKDNSKEIDRGFTTRRFKEDRFVFTLRDVYNKGTQSARFFIDGILYLPDEIFTFGQYTYLYIPTDLVKVNSIIEVEQIINGSYKEFPFNIISSRSEAIINVPENLYNLSDLKLIDVEGNQYDLNDFYIYSEINGSAVNYFRDKYENFKGGKLKIKPKDDKYIPSKLTVVLSKEELVVDTTYTSDSYGAEHVLDLNVDCMYNPRRLRIFKNGRLIPTYNSSYSTGTSYKNIKLSIQAGMRRGDKFHIEMLPIDYNMIVDVYKIPNNGVVNLQGLINRPFDLEWYDVYVNGKRMTKDNFEFVTPLLFKLKGVDSLINLWIYEKGRQKDVITIGNSTTVVDKIWREDERFQDALIDFETGNKDEEKDVLTESIYWYIQEMKEFFYNEMEASMGIYHINPDTEQISAEVKSKYPRLFRKSPDVLHLNPDVGKGKKETVILHVNPDNSRDSVISNEVKDMYERFMLLVGMHINPDIDQITPEMRGLYKNLFGENNGFYINPDYLFESSKPQIFNINPDL